jgi:Xaa-Pro aminopeptidase
MSIVLSDSILEYMKCIKNSNELEGMINCHIRDGAALAVGFSYLEQQVKKGILISEYEFAIYLNHLRS